VSAATWEKSRVVAGKNAYRLTEDLTQTKIAVLVFFNFCTFHLKNGEKLALSAHLEKQDEIKQVLDPKIKRKEVYPIKKEKSEYIDIGHLAD
jgi:hypothetical protein